MARMGRRHESLMTPSEILLRRCRGGSRHCDTPSSVIARRRFLPVMARRRLSPSLKSGEAAEAIKAGRPTSHGREAYRVAAPILDCFARACARARNDGEGDNWIASRSLTLALAMTAGRPCRESYAGGEG